MADMGENKVTIRSGYFVIEEDSTIDQIRHIHTDLFNYFYCAFADLDPNSYGVIVPKSKFDIISNFSKTIKQKSHDAKTLLSIGTADGADSSTFSDMVIMKERRTSFIDSSLSLMREYGFDGLDLHWIFPSTTRDVENLRYLLQEWREAVGDTTLLVATVFYLPNLSKAKIVYPIYEMRTYLNWINVQSYDFYPQLTPKKGLTGPTHAYLNKIEKNLCGYSGFQEWFKTQQFPANKTVVGIPFHGWKWTLVDDKDNHLFSPASPVENGMVKYKEIASLIPDFKNSSTYVGDYVTTYVTKEKLWIGYDDERSITDKIEKARKDGKYLLRGYYVWDLNADDSKFSLATAAFIAWK